jgi:tetratricopeptide (TPR) repeat protein
LKWQTETTDTQVVYSGEPPLKPGGRYLAIVTTDKGDSSKQEVGANLRFGVLPEDRAEAIAAEVAVIKGQGLTPEAEALVLTYLYESNALKAEAIALLRGLTERESQTRAVYTLLGDLYLQAELNQQAKEAYSQSLALAQQSGDIEGQAESQLGLGEASYGLAKKEEALEWLKRARASYGELGDEPQVKALGKRIGQIQNSGS